MIFKCNNYPKACCTCATWVKEKDGYLIGEGSTGWKVICAECLDADYPTLVKTAPVVIVEPEENSLFDF